MTPNSTTFATEWIQSTLRVKEWGKIEKGMRRKMHRWRDEWSIGDDERTCIGKQSNQDKHAIWIVEKAEEERVGRVGQSM